MAASIQREIREIPGNKTCVDCPTRNPQWASVSYGTLMCLECSGKHRSLGVHLSFVRSIQMDSWTEKQIKVMHIGGNKKFQTFLKEKNVDNAMDIRKKYYLEECALYRLRLQALRDGKKPPNELPAEQKKQYRRSGSTDSSNSKGGSNNSGGGGGNGNETPMERELRLRREAKERLRAKFGDGGLKGQNTASYRPPASSDGGNNATDDVTAALTSTFGWLSDTAKKTASVVSEQTSKVVNTVTDEEFQNNLRSKATNTWKSTVDTLNDPTLTDKVSKSASTGWNSLLSGTQSLWNSVQETAKTVLTPEEEAVQRQQQQQSINQRHNNSYGGNNNNTNNNNVRRSQSTDSTDDEWLQQQLNSAKSSLKKEKQRASSQPITDDDWGDVDWGDTPTKNNDKQEKKASSVIGRAQELAKEKVKDDNNTSNNSSKTMSKKNTKKKEEVSDDDFFGNWGA